ncbi:MAG: type II toxin-antitoxin system VapC family toxin [Xanthomonadales bacterium]|jgi:hypothetical protein|nr:type II toxin-antitoxin system VapC family toxin [Xanthomonadales bacterium]
MSWVFDSNVFIYHLNGQLGAAGISLLRAGLLRGGAYSVISRIEVLGFAQPEAELATAAALFAGLQPIAVDDAVITESIRLRRTRKIKIPDALIAASALTRGLPLVTHNLADFQWISGLTLIDPERQTTPCRQAQEPQP